jgi:hypothetical protein
MKGKYKKFKTDCKMYMITMKLGDKWGRKKSRETHYRSWNYITQSNGKRNMGHPIKSSYWMTFYGTCVIIITIELAENNTNN